MGAQTYFANISNSLRWTRPVWEEEYDTRQVYARGDEAGRGGANTHGVAWPGSAPLNATFWHRVTEKMLADLDAKSSSSSSTPSSSSPLLDLYNTYETKSSDATVHRGGDEKSAEQKVCFIRAGSGALGTACRTKFGGRDARGLRERKFGMV